jgi:transposase InsO family protein
VAKVRLPDKLKELRKPKAVVGAFADGRVPFEQQTKCDHTLAELSKVYRLRCIECLLRSWPELDAKKVDKRVRRLLCQMGLEAFYPKPRLSRPDPAAGRYRYLLRDLKVTRPDQVWRADITYIGLPDGFAYLVAIMDWFSRYVIAWELSNSMESAFCVAALERALATRRQPEIQH